MTHSPGVSQPERPQRGCAACAGLAAPKGTSRASAAKASIDEAVQVQTAVQHEGWCLCGRSALDRRDEGDCTATGISPGILWPD